VPRLDLWGVVDEQRQGVWRLVKWVCATACIQQNVTTVCQVHAKPAAVYVVSKNYENVQPSPLVTCLLPKPLPQVAWS
jgi:hypothetical protein